MQIAWAIRYLDRSQPIGAHGKRTASLRGCLKPRRLADLASSHGITDDSDRARVQKFEQPTRSEGPDESRHLLQPDRLDGAGLEEDQSSHQCAYVDDDLILAGDFGGDSSNVMVASVHTPMVPPRRVAGNLQSAGRGSAFASLADVTRSAHGVWDERPVYWTVRYAVADAEWDPDVQATVTGQRPLVVLEPTFQLQASAPAELATCGPRPAAFDGPDLYFTVMVHVAPARVAARRLAMTPGLIGLVRLVMRTVSEPLGAVVFGGAGVGVTPGGVVP
jgi:hypothetical protein